MSVDTLRLGTVAHVEPESLARRGWTVTTVQGSEAESRVTAQVKLANGAWASVGRYPSGPIWASVEASLPKIVAGSNEIVLDWPGVQYGAGELVGEFESAASVRLPPVGEWTVSRIDACWAWPDVPDAYIVALALGTVPRCSMAFYGSGARWFYPAGSVYGRVYDKAQERRCSVDLPLRVERQARPKKHKVTVDGEQVGGPWASFSEATALALVRELVATVGLSEPIRTPLAVRSRLVDIHGPRCGENVYRAFLAAREAGGWPAAGGSDAAKRRARRLAREAGVVTLSDVELPPLVVPN